MGWSTQFIDTLDNKAKVIHYSLKFLAIPSLSVGEEYTIGSEIKIGSADVTIDSVQITPSRWSVNFGGFTIVLNGDLRPILQTSLRKGAIAELIMIRDGVRNRVSIGQLRSLTGGRGVWRLDFADFLSLMQSRITTTTTQANFWHNAGKTALTTQSFNFSSSANLYLDDITPFERETGQDGMIFVEDSQHSVTMYWRWSSKTTTTAPAGYLTISAVDQYPSESDHDHLQVGDRVTSLARLRGRPDHVFARLVMSTGNATQGVFDDYPASWGLGVKWNPNLFNLQNLNTYYSQVWAMFPVWRQNELSWRACQNPNQASFFSVVDHITDRDIVSIDSHSIYAPSQSTIYSRSVIKTYNNTTGLDQDVVSSGNSIAVLPADYEIVRDLRLVYRFDNPIQPTQANTDLKRMRRWDAEPYEELSITVTEKHCLLTAGDIIEISSKYIYGLRESAGDTYSNRRAMILGVRWNPSQSTVNLTLGVLS